MDRRKGDEMRGLSRASVSMAIIAGAAAYLMYETMVSEGLLSYYYTADEVIVDRDAFAGRRIRVGGYVEACSILQRKGTLDFRFEVRPDHPHNVEDTLRFPAARGKTIAVHYSGVVPDTFKDDAEVTVGGVLRADGVFIAREMTAKCPSKYEAAEKNLATKRPKRECGGVRDPQMSASFQL